MLCLYIITRGVYKMNHKHDTSNWLFDAEDKFNKLDDKTDAITNQVKLMKQSVKDIVSTIKKLLQYDHNSRTETQI